MQFLKKILIQTSILLIYCTMAWRCSGNTNKELIENLYRGGIIQSEIVKQTMLKVDRQYFTKYPYDDSPQQIGYGATISAPHMHAYALESLKDYLKPGNKALDIGCGSGYLTACMAEMVGPEGYVAGVDHIQQLTDLAKKNIAKHSNMKQVEIHTGDGRDGYLPGAPYDCIHVGAASPDHPTALLEQLKAPGIMFIPVGDSTQYIYEFIKDKQGQIIKKKLMGVRYVPLTDSKSQWP